MRLAELFVCPCTLLPTRCDMFVCESVFVGLLVRVCVGARERECVCVCRCGIHR